MKEINELEFPKGSAVERLKNQIFNLVNDKEIENKRIEINFNPENFQKVREILGKNEYSMQVDPINNKIILDVSHKEQIELSKMLNESNVEHKTYLMLRNRMKEYSSSVNDSLRLAAYELVSDNNNRIKLGKSHQIKSVLDTSIVYSLGDYLIMGSKGSIKMAEKDLAERNATEAKIYSEVQPLELPKIREHTSTVNTQPILKYKG